MSCFLKHSQDTTINVVRFNEIDNVIFYEILVKCGPSVFWTVISFNWISRCSYFKLFVLFPKVSRRYKEFEKLNDALVNECSLDKTWLPGKKVIGNKSTSFVKKR